MLSPSPEVLGVVSPPLVSTLPQTFNAFTRKVWGETGLQGTGERPSGGLWSRGPCLVWGVRWRSYRSSQSVISLSLTQLLWRTWPSPGALMTEPGAQAGRASLATQRLGLEKMRRWGETVGQESARQKPIICLSITPLSASSSCGDKLQVWPRLVTLSSRPPRDQDPGRDWLPAEVTASLLTRAVTSQGRGGQGMGGGSVPTFTTPHMCFRTWGKFHYSVRRWGD